MKLHLSLEELKLVQHMADMEKSRLEDQERASMTINNRDLVAEIDKLLLYINDEIRKAE